MKKTINVGTPYQPCCWSCDGLNRKRLLANGLSPFSVPSAFIVCPQCGNKRCPKALNEIYRCTNSNAPGQARQIDEQRIFQLRLDGSPLLGESEKDN